MIRIPERLMPQEKYSKSAIMPINAGTAPSPKTKAMGMVNEMAISLFSESHRKEAFAERNG